MLALLVVLPLGCDRGTVSEDGRAAAATSDRDRVETLDAVARGYVHVALALGERDPDSLDFSVAPEAERAAVHRSYPSLDAIDAEVNRLLEDLRAIGSSGRYSERNRFLGLQLRAVQTRTAMLRGRMLPFDREASALFNTARLPDTGVDDRVRIRAGLAVLLGQKGGVPGGKGDLAKRYAMYDRRFLIPPERLPDVLRAALSRCRASTLASMELPAGESVDLKYVRNEPWSAFSRYRGHGQSTISVNLDLPLTVDDALELACHEGYPGHHVFNLLRDAALAEAGRLPEAQVQLTFTPQSYLSESAASYAPRLAFSEAERISVERDLLFPLAGLAPSTAARYVRISSLVRRLSSAEPEIARDYLDGNLEFVRAEDRLSREMLMVHAEASLLYLNEYRSYMLAYTDGPRRVEAYLGRAGKGASDDRRQRWERFAALARTSQDPF